VVISISGIPRRPSEYRTESPESDNFLAESSSRHTDVMPTLPFDVSIFPFTAIRDVLWNPDVFDPSMTIFLMHSITGRIVHPRDAATLSAVFKASSFIDLGGSSS